MRYFFLFFLSSSLFAYTFTGYNIALSLGGVSQGGELNQTATTTLIFPDRAGNLRTLSTRNTSTLYTLSPVGEFSIGWGRSLGYFYLGFLGGINISCGNIKETLGATFSIDAIESASLNNSLNIYFNIVEPTLDGKFGFQFCNNLIYGIIGGAYNVVYFDESIHYNFENTPSPVIRISNPIDKKKAHRLYGLRLGAGLEHLFTSSCSLFMGYIYTHFPEKTIENTKGFTSLLSSGSQFVSLTHQPREHLFSFGVRYYW